MKPLLPNSFLRALDERRAGAALRSLSSNHGGVDLCSNDYLGVARILGAEAAQLSASGGATGSRLVSGNTPEHEALESFLATFHGAPAALLFGSGYEANLGLLSNLGGRHDTVIHDELVHASMRDGVRLGQARSFSFRHNDPDDLRQKISAARGEVYVAVESLYSMDGHQAPLQDLVAVCREKGAFLVVDEAHATGVFGERGEGLVQALGVADQVFARVHTFGKALGFRGGVVIGAAELREYLINFSRPFIYSTAPDLRSLDMIRLAYELQAGMEVERAKLRGLVEAFRALTEEFPMLQFLESDSPIQGIIVPGNREVLAAEAALAEQGYFARAIRSPTVPAGTERLRLCLHAFNTEVELRSAVATLNQARSSRRVAANE